MQSVQVQTWQSVTNLGRRLTNNQHIYVNTAHALSRGTHQVACLCSINGKGLKAVSHILLVIIILRHGGVLYKRPCTCRPKPLKSHENIVN